MAICISSTAFEGNGQDHTVHGLIKKPNGLWKRLEMLPDAGRAGRLIAQGTGQEKVICPAMCITAIYIPQSAQGRTRQEGPGCIQSGFNVRR